MDRETLIARLTDIVGKENIVTEPDDLLLYIFNAGPKAQQASFHSKHVPIAAVQPGSAQEISQIMRIAHEKGFPVIARGQASGLAENTRITKENTIVLSTMRLTKLEIEPETLTATVGPGVVTVEIKKAAGKFGLLYPPDPASFGYSTIGGNVATDAGGLQCVKYGTTRSYVAGLEVVLADGEIIRTGNKCIKDVAGYNLTQLFVGSEGTLGIITEIILKLIPLPPAKKAMMAIFNDLEAAGAAVSKVMVSGVVPSIMEFMDNTLIRAVEEVIHQGLPVDAEAILLMEVDGDPAVLDGQVEKISSVCKGLGVREIRVANTPEEIDAIWEGRRNCLPSLSRVSKSRMSGDPAAPINRLPEELRKLKELGKKYNVKTACYGHAGDGNLHPCFLYDNDEEYERATKVKDEFYAFMLTIGGTVTAEHGVGNEKTKYMKDQFGPVAYGIMTGIKKLLDPKNILNPGCLFGENL
ncbi:MAG: FAD-binding protein [Desulfovibrio sp.]|jgi:glycolate oxidase subunit GlcD|nr:FAD-binding protein [Desulfovibrio sp.]